MFVGLMGYPEGKVTVKTSPFVSITRIAIGSCAPSKYGEDRGTKQ